MFLINCLRGFRTLRLNNFALCVVLSSLVLVNVSIYSIRSDGSGNHFINEIEHVLKSKSYDNQKLLHQLKLNKYHELSDQDLQPEQSQFYSREEIHALSKHYHLKEFDCSKIFANVSEEIGPAVEYVKKQRKHIAQLSVRQEAYINMTANCAHFIQSRGYIMSPLSSLEENFPIAYSIVAYRDTEMMERLLRAIYRPNNFYCIHMDDGVRKPLHQALAVSYLFSFIDIKRISFLFFCFIDFFFLLEN